MRILIGTTNPSKVKQFESMLAGHDVEFITLRDLGIQKEPQETGTTPEENARIKAEFYGRFFESVICGDSGLYFNELDLRDPRQPGLHIRTPNGVRLDDEEMIAYYRGLVHSLGGRVTAYYLNGIAVYHNGKVMSRMESREVVEASMFYMIDKPSPLRHEGWPLDSISMNKHTKKLFVDCGNAKGSNEEDKIIIGEYRRQMVDFLVLSLGLAENRK